MNLSTLLNLHHLTDEKLVAFTGSGGKTTLMYQISRALSAAGRRSICTTTTRIAIPGPDESPRWMLLKDNYEECRSFWEDEHDSPHRLTLGWELDETGTKLTGLPLDMVHRISAWKGLDTLLIEADGSRGKSLKGYRSGEPVLPREEHCTMVILGMDVLGKPIDAVHMHRPEIVKEHMAVPPGDMTVNARHLETMLFHPEGYLAKAGSGRRILVLNKIENQEHYRSALELSHRVSSHGIPVVFRGPLWGYEEGRYFALHLPREKNP
jgi:probable selenium-dependent hydroxylase accessory protein YqeC